MKIFLFSWSFSKLVLCEIHMLSFEHMEFYKVNLTKISFSHRDLKLFLSENVSVQHLTFMKLLFSPQDFLLLLSIL